MAEPITNGMLLEHLQSMKVDFRRLEKKVDGLEMKTDALQCEVRQGFAEAKIHRQALQEDLEASMRMLYKHEVKLGRL